MYIPAQVLSVVVVNAEYVEVCRNAERLVFLEDSHKMKRVTIHYPDGKQISYSFPSDVEITDHLNYAFQTGSLQNLPSPVDSQDAQPARIGGDYVFVLMQPIRVPDEDDEVYLVPMRTGRDISRDGVRAAVLETFGPEAMDADSLRAHGNAAGDREGKEENLHQQIMHVLFIKKKSVKSGLILYTCTCASYHEFVQEV